MSDLRQRAWLVPPGPTIAGIPMRGITGGTSELLADLGVHLLTDFAAVIAGGELAAKREFLTFLFVHGYRVGDDEVANVEAMLRAVREAHFLRDFLTPFAMQITIEEAMPAVIEWIGTVNKSTMDSLFRVLKKLAPEATLPDPGSPKAFGPPGSPR